MYKTTFEMRIPPPLIRAFSADPRVSAIERLHCTVEPYMYNGMFAVFNINISFALLLVNITRIEAVSTLGLLMLTRC